MSDVVYRSEVRIERVRGPVRKAYLPAERDPVIFGVHGAVETHYKITPGAFEPRATTLDYIVAAAAGGLAGTFGGALEARKISAAGDRLTADAVGEIEKEEGVLVIRRIHVRMNLKAPAADRETWERVNGICQDPCPVYRSLRAAIATSSELRFEPLPEETPV